MELDDQSSIDGGGGTAVVSMTTNSLLKDSFSVSMHDRRINGGVGGGSSTISNEEKDLLDNFFETVQDYVCEEQQKATTSTTAKQFPLSPNSLVSSTASTTTYRNQKDIIDYVFENIENATCNRNYDTSSGITKSKSIEKLQMLGQTIHKKFSSENGGIEAREKLDEWFTDRFFGERTICKGEQNQQRLQKLQKQKPDDSGLFLDHFFQRMDKFVCVTVEDHVPPPSTDHRDDNNHVPTVATRPAHNHQQSSGSIHYDYESTSTPTNHSRSHSHSHHRSSSVLLLSPCSTTSSQSSFVETPRSLADTPRSLGAESDYMSVVSETEHSRSTVGSSIYSHSERSSRMGYSVISPRSATEHTDRTYGTDCLSPKTDASSTVHSRSISGHDATGNLLSMSSSSSSDADDDDDQTSAFGTVSRPLFVITEEVSATESMASGRIKVKKSSGSESKKSKRNALSKINRSLKKTNPFRYSSTYYKFDRTACEPAAAARTAQSWLESFKFTMEVTAIRVSTAIENFDTTAACGSNGSVYDDNDSNTSKLKDFAHNQMASIGSKICDTKQALSKQVDRSRCASVSLMKQEKTDKHDSVALVDDNNDEEATHPDDETSRQQEPPAANASSTCVITERGCDPEPSFQLMKLDKDAFVDSLRSYAHCTLQTEVHDGPAASGEEGGEESNEKPIKSPRSSETDKTAELTTISSGVHHDDEEDCDDDVGHDDQEENTSTVFGSVYGSVVAHQQTNYNNVNHANKYDDDMDTTMAQFNDMIVSIPSPTKSTTSARVIDNAPATTTTANRAVDVVDMPLAEQSPPASKESKDTDAVAISVDEEEFTAICDSIDLDIPEIAEHESASKHSHSTKTSNKDNGSSHTIEHHQQRQQW